MRTGGGNVSRFAHALQGIEVRKAGSGPPCFSLTRARHRCWGYGIDPNALWPKLCREVADDGLQRHLCRALSAGCRR